MSQHCLAPLRGCTVEPFGCLPVLPVPAVELLVRYFLEGAEAEAAEATAASPTVAAQSPKASPPSPHSVLPPLPTWPDTLPSPAAPAAAEAGQWPAEGAAALGNGMLSPGSGLAVEGIWLYPIKSCRGQQARAWPLGEWHHRFRARYHRPLPVRRHGMTARSVLYLLGAPHVFSALLLALLLLQDPLACCTTVTGCWWTALAPRSRCASARRWPPSSQRWT